LPRQLLTTRLFSRCRLALLLLELQLHALHCGIAGSHDLFERHSGAPFKLSVRGDPRAG
jgi:hypothetical protein